MNSQTDDRTTTQTNLEKAIEIAKKDSAFNPLAKRFIYNVGPDKFMISPTMISGVLMSAYQGGEFYHAPNETALRQMARNV